MKEPHSAIPLTTIDIFIGGLLDWYSGIVVGYHQAWRGQHPERTCAYFEHHQQRKIIAAASLAIKRHPDTAINLIGHSWGAVTAIKVAAKLARQGVRVNRVISIDPVCRGKRAMVPEGIAWINVNAAPTTSNGWRGDYYATLGGKWVDWPCDKTTCHQGAPCHHNEFRALFEYTPPGGVSARDQLLA